MPYVIKHKLTSEIYTCTLINIYDFAYHGVKVWDTFDAAQAQFASLLLEQGMDKLWDWEIHELTENQTKMGNVKLNNNAAKRLYLSLIHI